MLKRHSKNSKIHKAQNWGGHSGLGDNITMIGAINFLLQYFEKIYFLCKNIYQENVKLLFYNKPVIIISFDQNNEQEECKKIINDIFKLDNTINIFISGFCHTCYLKSNINHPELLNYTVSENKYSISYDHINAFYQDIGLRIFQGQAGEPCSAVCGADSPGWNAIKSRHRGSEPASAGRCLEIEASAHQNSGKRCCGRRRRIMEP